MTYTLDQLQYLIFKAREKFRKKLAWAVIGREQALSIAQELDAMKRGDRIIELPGDGFYEKHVRECDEKVDKRYRGKIVVPGALPFPALQGIRVWFKDGVKGFNILVKGIGMVEFADSEEGPEGRA